MNEERGISDYCRQIETYLCRKNEGHLIRIVGPAFERVTSWAEQGVPLKVAFRGIDQYCERYYAKKRRRRPVRIEFCEADILDLFDDWRRAVGLSPAGAEAGNGSTSAHRKPPLGEHVDRVIARLLGRAQKDTGSVPPERIDAIVRELDPLAAAARSARGAKRTAIVERLRHIDETLMEAAREAMSPTVASGLHGEAEAELAQFGDRLTPEARRRAVEAAYDRLVRESLGLPRLVFDE
jgi:hypothetical protein